MRKLKPILTLLLLCSFFVAGAQQPNVNRQIKGTVTDKSGQPLFGATVRIAQTNYAAATEKNGAFTVSYPATYPKPTIMLTVSFVGYKTKEVVYISGQTLKITLDEDAVDIGGVVVTGVSRRATSSYTGSVLTADAEQLQRFGNRDLATSLSNIDPAFNIVTNNQFGSDPTRLPEIVIRGGSSVPTLEQIGDEKARAELNSPLIIIDGFESNLQKFVSMNPNDVESLSLLKDATSTAIYGSRGANGVLVITTRRPTVGSPRVTYRGDVTVEMPDLSSYNLMNASEKLQLEKSAGLYNYTPSGFDNAGYNYIYDQYYNYLLSEVGRGINTYWLSKPLQTSVGHTQYVRLEGGSRELNYSGSISYKNVPGVMKESYNNNLNSTFMLVYEHKKVRVRNNFMLNTSNSSRSPYGNFSDYVKMNPYWTTEDADGNLLKTLGVPSLSIVDATTQKNFASAYWSTAYKGKYPSNPLYNATLNVFDKSQSQSITNQTELEYKVNQDLSFTGRFAISKAVGQDDAFKPADHTDFAGYTDADFNRRGNYKYGSQNSSKLDGQVIMNYSKLINKVHSITVDGRANLVENKNYSYSFLAEGFNNEKFDFISMAAGYPPSSRPGGSESLSRLASFYGGGSYTYDGRYVVDGAISSDGSSLYGNKNHFSTFWSAGAKWNLHNESFLKTSSFVNKLSLYYSVGTSGSVNFSPYQAIPTYRYFSGSDYMGYLGAYLRSIGNPDLKWQTKLSTTYGADLIVLDGKIGLHGEIYNHKVTNLVTSQELMGANGFESYTTNSGEKQIDGYQVNVMWSPIKNRNGLNWSLMAAINYEKDKFKNLPTAIEEAQMRTDNPYSVGDFYKSGYSVNSIWVPKSLGIDPATGKEVYLDKDGNPTFTWDKNNYINAGTKVPAYRGTFSSFLRYKNWGLNASFKYQFGGQIYNQTLIDRVEITKEQMKFNVDKRVYTGRWQKPGDVTPFKSLYDNTPTRKSTRFVQDEASLDFTNIQLEYTLTPKNKSLLGIEYLLLRLNVDDVFHISTVKMERGLSYPFSRRASFSVELAF